MVVITEALGPTSIPHFQLKMSTEYSRSVLRMVVAQICQTIGWHSINSTPLEFLVDLMQEYILRMSKLTHQYAEILGRTEANLDDLGLAFKHMNIDIQELSEYVKNVDSVPCPIAVPKFPIKRESHLNFLKPGSREVVTRPVHVHEHLPAMYPDTEEEYIPEKTEILTNGTSESPTSINGPTPAVTPTNSGSTATGPNVSPHRTSPQVVFKRPGDPVSFDSPIVKRMKVSEEGRPLREIHSVMMTTSGFLSPAREGKLPEARTPHQTRSDSPQPTSYPMVPPELKYDKKPKKLIKKSQGDRKLDKENKKKNRAKQLFKPDKIDDVKVKKLAGMKEMAKLKALKPGGGKVPGAAPGPSSRPSTPKLMSPKAAGSPKLSKTGQPKVKPEKIPDQTVGSPQPERKEDNIDKLPSEPDRQKLNIFKKISKPREDKEKEKEPAEQHKLKELDSRDSSPGLIIDENNEKHAFRASDTETPKREEKKTPRTPDVHLQPENELVDLQSPGSDVYMFDDMSPPGTPNTPKTPELNVPTPTEQKKKKKEKSGKKKEPKLRSPKHCISPKKTKLSSEPADSDILDRPKTPQAPEPPVHRDPVLPPTLPFPFFPTFPPAPGLIPHPMFTRFPLPLGRPGPGPGPGPHPHPAMPNLPLPPRFLNPAAKTEDFSLGLKIKPVDKERPLPSPNMESPILPPSSMTMKHEKQEKDKPEKIVKAFKQEKEIPVQAPTNIVAPPPSSAPVAPNVYPTAPISAVPPLPSKLSKIDKPEKNDKKSKEHKKEKKEKLKKKKEKKEKYKEKGEKSKEKKEKLDKKDKLEKIKEKKEKKEKKKEKDTSKKIAKEDKNAEAVPKLTLRLGAALPRPPTPDNTPMKKITIKTVLKKPEEEVKREPSPELAKISALVTRPPKQKSAKAKADAAPKKEDAKEDKENGRIVLPTTPTTTVDQGGLQVWICPACGFQDDGSPMVGCDGCDAWYHWVCVGMQVPPADTEDWYCRFCLVKKKEHYDNKKKKKRKKKVKVNA